MVSCLNAAGGLYGPGLLETPKATPSVAFRSPFLNQTRAGSSTPLQDGNGSNYSFDDLGLGSYVVLSAPANATESQLNVPALDAMICQRGSAAKSCFGHAAQAINVYSGAPPIPISPVRKLIFRLRNGGYNSATLCVRRPIRQCGHPLLAHRQHHFSGRSC